MKGPPLTKLFIGDICDEEEEEVDGEVEEEDGVVCLLTRHGDVEEDEASKVLVD